MSGRSRHWVTLLRARPVRLGAVLLVSLLLTAVLVQRYLLVHPVPAVQVGPHALEMAVKGAGELVAREQAEVSSPATLAVESVLVDTGDRVRRGQPLVLLDSAELVAQVRAAEASAQTARQSIELARLTHRRAEVARRHSEAEAQRALALAARGPDAIAASELDASLSAAASAELDAGSSQLQIDTATQAHAEALANLALVRARLDNATLRAPFDGLVTGRQCSAGDTATPGTPCLTVVNPDSLRVQARFDESALPLVRIGDPVTLRLKSRLQTSLQGRVERIHRAVDVDTREFAVDLRLQELPQAWALGERATVEVRAQERHAALAIPRDLVVSARHGRSVWVMREGRARQVPLQLGLDDGRWVEVLSGLSAGDTLLQPDTVRSGMRVRPELQPW